MRSDHLLPLRFIPADAGNTQPEQQGCALKTVYPRWRGEHAKYQVAPICRDGLSPLARGTRAAPLREDLRNRFIPAGAGNTSSAFAMSASISVYPRWRGEHIRSVKPSPFTFGLSPLARGTHSLIRPYDRLARFIPAGAGNTCAIWNQLARCSVYPRWRGEHGTMRKSEVIEHGLSPLARGTRLRLM